MVNNPYQYEIQEMDNLSFDDEKKAKKITVADDTVLTELTTVLRNLLNALNNPGWLDKTANRLRADITGSLTTAGTISTVTTVTTVSTVTAVTTVGNQTNIDSYPGSMLIKNMGSTAWASMCRARIS